MGFGQGLSGLDAAAQNLDVVGNNIANAGTVGFKTGSATFSDVYASSLVGLGVQVASVNQRFTAGTVSLTGNQFDMAIDGANGLFVVKDPGGKVLYTRNGQFLSDKNNNIVNSQGQQLMGYAAGGTTLVGLTVPIGNIPPQATAKITNTVNLDANAAVVPGTAVPEQVGLAVLDDGTGPVNHYYRVSSAGAYTWYTDAAGTAPGGTPADGTSYATNGGVDSLTFTGGVPDGAIPSAGGNVAYAAPVAAVPFSPNNAASFSNMTPITVYDSLGNAHTVQQYYTKREPSIGGNSVWEVNYVVDGIPASTATLQFDTAGRLAAGSPATITFTSGGAASPAEPMNIQVAYDGSTQFGGDFSQNFTQDGYGTGEYASMSIGADGSLIANYTNGATKVVGNLVLANFNNLQGLQPVGGSAWAETASSGQAILGTPGSSGLAQIKGQAVEESNVDVSQELVNLIIAQRTYQANAQSIKAQDQVLQTLINMN
ncbi:hypothetical protein CDEF62S_03935 [Castellaniella defragrans]